MIVHRVITAYRLKRALKSLKQLNEEIFNCFIQPQYPSQMSLYEYRIHQQKIHFLKHYKRLKNPEYPLKTLYEITLIYSQLRYRVADHATFEICVKELIDLKEIISRVYDDLIKKNLTQLKLTIQKLEHTIKLFEDNSKQVLEVVAAEPRAFLVFIDNIKDFAKLQ